MANFRYLHARQQFDHVRHFSVVHRIYRVGGTIPLHSSGLMNSMGSSVRAAQSRCRGTRGQRLLPNRALAQSAEHAPRGLQ